MNIEETKIAILDELKRGPAIAADLSGVLGSSIGDTAKALRRLREDGAIVIENGAYMLPDENEGKRAGKSKAKTKDESKTPDAVIENPEVRFVAPKVAPSPYKPATPSVPAFSDMVSKFIVDMANAPDESAKGVLLTAEGYDSLADVLSRAFDQAAGGKGHERHAVDKPFDEQPMQGIQDLVGSGFALGQAIKKIQESQRLPAGRDVAELLGAINYIAGAVIHIEALGRGDNDTRNHS